MDTPPDNEKIRSGYVAIVGRPNVGKSTLLNHLIGEKISIVSRKAQTTRHRITGILTQDDAQFVFVDTPGFQTQHTNALNRAMADVAGIALTPEDRQRLIHPLVGGVILFSRNYRDPEQLAALCRDIHGLRQPALLISIDHEGGRVQRCREGFTRLPPMAALGRHWDRNPGEALAGAEALGYVLAAELRAAGVDFSYAPVLDLNFGRSSVIGDRSLHRNPQAVTDLARALIRGMLVLQQEQEISVLK